MQDLITIKKRSDYTNDLTKEMDTYRKFKTVYTFKTYIYDKYKDMYPIRFPVATIGHIRVDENEIITEIILYKGESYDTSKIYESNVEECFEKYIGMRIVIDES